MLHFILFFLAYAVGAGILFTRLKNKNENLRFQDVFWTYMTSTGLAVVFAFAGTKGNLFHWALLVVYAAIGYYLTYKMLEKKDVLVSAAAGGLNTAMSAYGGAKPRPESMAASEAKSNLRFVIIAGIVKLLVLLCFTSFPTLQHDYYQAAGIGFNIGGIAAVILSYLMVLNAYKAVLPSQSGFVYWVGWAILFAGGLWLSTGFAG